MERNGYEMSHDIMSQQKQTRKKNPMSIFLINQKTKTSKKNKSQHSSYEVSKHKTCDCKKHGKR
jgi:hypothetical protein